MLRVLIRDDLWSNSGVRAMRGVGISLEAVMQSLTA